MIEGLTLSIPQRLQLLRIVVTLSLLISIALSFNLWAGYRHFPYAPVLLLPFILPPFDGIFIFLVGVCLVTSLFFKYTRSFIFVALLINVLLVLLDINRLQPWFYYYNALLFVFLFYNGRVDNSNKYTSIFIILQFIIAAVYVYNGINKLNSNFVSTDFVEIISPLKTILTHRQFLFLTKTGAIIPYILIFIGLGLIILPLRYLAITLACVIHFCLLIFLFPNETNQNYALWFMNVFFLFALFLLFSGKTKQRYFSPAILFQKPLFYLIIILFWILPFFSLVNMYPSNLSANFKSGNTSTMRFSITKQQHRQLDYYVQNFFIQKDSLYFLNYTNWCLQELKSDCNPEEEEFKAICQQITKTFSPIVKETQFIIKPKQTLFTTK